ncbi:hypothetical protein PF005_g23755 [Phytophthora fragariae]|uniref:Uncharacterized protein n=2 Tax=Phytophthora TaxID=4783 RepID=A0A6A3JYD4_9STRA|nr:hypothetical protein PF003_g1948 [Phytophthora fragariae]KAE9284611.1 hypothetical protein PR003_g26809 [Phytophthora rubi]KAE8926548.1 hypothetical protein PF009_g23268 [Phytophthora fragariae]KAE8998318.1 hypothetical protein PF011_g15110 [Phytophthora fragariae]KAE9081229.1 hypothetical protein PF007_g22748 [Phytophthora fragariae]
MNASHSSSGSSSSVGDNVGDAPTPVTKTVSSNSADSCTWYADASCRRPRTCYDCLNVQVSGGECAIMPNGMCVNLDEYAHFLSTQEEFGIYYKYYPSKEYAYCSIDDAACSACTSTWISDYKNAGTIETPSYCTGLDGCLCLARCELPDWSSSIVADQCSSSGTIGTKTQTSTASRIGFALAVGAAFGVLLGLWGIKLLLRGRGNGRGRGSYVPAIRDTWAVPRSSPKGPQLELTAWKELREKLIAIEQEAFGIQNEATAGEAQADSTVADTPDALEEGDVYHAMSPSQAARQPSDAPRLQS